MQCYTELLPPTGVTHALSVPFLSATANNLIVARSSLLQVFSLLKASPQSQTENTETHSSGTKLILEKEYPLPGTVTDLSRVKTLNTKSGGEAILLAVRNAKLSLIEWDPERQNISTISIHYYEREDLTRSPWAPDLSQCGSHLTVDPSSRCAIFNFGIRNLAILPFHQAGDDLVMDDYDSELDGERPNPRAGEGNVAEKQDGSAYQTPYAASFVLPLTALDPSLLHPVSLAFLYEYREPTFGILYSQVATSAALAHERKDVMFYAVFTLDLEQRASTTLLSVSRLPSDLFKVVALPSPVGGALLIGSNEIVHVDQGGKTNAVGVNEFSRQASSFSMSDQSDLALRLEGCVVERLGGDSGDLLLALKSGDMALIRFKLDGRSVSGMAVQSLSTQEGGFSLKSAASCSACFGDGNVFIGSEDGDSVLLGWSHPSSSTKKLRSSKETAHGIEGLSDDEDMEDDVYDDDLYSSAPAPTQSGSRNASESTTAEYCQFQLLDRLSSIGPLRDVTLGKAVPLTKPREDGSSTGVSSELELVASQGSGRAGGLAVLKREIDPLTTMSTLIEGADGVWSTTVTQGKAPVGNTEDSTENASRHYVIASRPIGTEKEISEVLEVEGQEFKPIKAPEFNPNEDFTIDIGSLAGGTRLVQVLRNEVRCYDKDLGLAQIYPIWDEETDEERVAVSAQFADPYVAILRDDSSLLLLQADDSGDLDEVSLPAEVANTKWHSSCIYHDKDQFFGQSGEVNNLILFAVNMDYRLSIFSIPDLTILSVVEGVDCLPPMLSAEPPRRSNTRESLKEILVANLGDRSKVSPYLIIRTSNDDLVVYIPVMIPSGSDSGLSGSLRFFREPNNTLPRLDSEKPADSVYQRTRPLRTLSNVSGLSTVFMPGTSAGFIIKTAASTPHVMRLRGESTQWLSSFNSSAPGCENGFIYVDSDGLIRVCHLPPDTQFDHQWTVRKVPVNEQVDFLTYSTSSETYVLGTSSPVGFKLPENDELHPEWRNEEITFLPEVPQSSIKVISPKTWSIIDSHPLDPAEHVTSVKNVNMEISENTHERKDLIVVGTAITKGEDIPARGCIYVFDVIEVVPEPGQPETGRKLKLVGKESVKGAVTALSGIGGQGFVVVAQGQKCMVRGLKEDGSLLPVAFMDMQCYVNVAKELKGTGMCILGDAVKGLWFAGYSEEPYKMTLFGKDPEYTEVVAADFLPEGEKLYMLVADSDCNLHVLQYDPEDPKSSNGDRLLNRSKFYTGNFASTVTLLPRTAVSSELVESGADEMDVDVSIASHHVLIAAQNGSLALVTTIAEDSYRRLTALQSQLANTIEHPGGLNPRAFRAVESDGAGGRGMVDGTLLRQWLSLGKQRQAEIAGRVGATDWEVRADLETVGGDGLGYL
ncbi:Cleavage/polyadenylation specificity factor A subunit C-terminal [Penicillium capsulatum]|uniref:Protein CFT1 n=1 Tax=Penicillium capsulatum TaxID=69766 RepID=A0A9W9IRG7_9EURO|nr:Cleavage/polyadenylation specificity factor A subunit C-terminal [Penicillium capsulatum]KAJ6121816.1 Cleavage/polyadenylation specificity factor A subunit C-terminal [Penicillium capsulatum]